MTHRLLLIFTILLVVSGACKPKPESRSNEGAIELMTTQTLGLAYLEEFELEKAEAEFLKYIKLAPKDKLGYANLGLTYLRMGNYPEAREQLLKALEIEPEDAETRLILATYYQMNDEPEMAISILVEALKFSPRNIKILYVLSELYSITSDSKSQSRRKTCMEQLIENAPGNIVPKLNLVEIYLNDGLADNALGLLESITKQFPEFPDEAAVFYEKTLDLLRKNDLDNALIQFTIFHNYMKVTSPYQAGIMDLKGPGGSLIGFPIIEYKQHSPTLGGEDESLLDVIEFQEVSESAGLGYYGNTEDYHKPDIRVLSHATAADYDSDGDIDIYFGSYDYATSTYKHFLYNNDLGSYRDVSSEVGIDHSGNEISARFTDYDNDGYLDLFIATEEGYILYSNAGKGAFIDVTEEAKLGNVVGDNQGIFADLDHDGDLDLFGFGEIGTRVYRNNADGTFSEQSEAMKLAGKSNDFGYDAAFGDFDDDNDLDLVAVSRSGTILYSNQRQGIFKDISMESGLSSLADAISVDVGDYNNDGFLDLVFTSAEPGKISLMKNKGDGSFEELANTKKMFAPIKNVKTYDARFLDFDNDGHLDLLIAGESTSEGQRGLFLYHNDDQDNFVDVSSLLPDNVNSGRQITLFDYNSDGDADALIAGLHGGVSLLRNDGGNMNHYVKMKLVGLLTGSAKNNHFGIGAKIEMRSGDLYQSTVVSQPEIHFGIGSRNSVDVIRITWTNGVPQNIFKPEADSDVVEAQILKGSCPFLYTWNGEEFVFVKDITWRSALGMPLGIMGENKAYGFADASDDYIKIPAEALKAKDGKYELRLTSELWETIYMDRIELAVADHPDSVDVYVPEQFTPPPFPDYDLYKVSRKVLPLSAIDQDGNNVLSCIDKEDDVYLAGFNSGKYQGITEMHSLTLDPGITTSNNELKLFMKGWVFPTDASINTALSQSEHIKVMWPVIQVKNHQGEWQNVLENFGFPMGKDKMVIVDLSGKFLTEDHRIRILTNMEIYWDYIFFQEGKSEAPVKTTFLDPVSANLHYRGFSRLYRKGGRYGPHWFNYNDVDKNQKWVDLVGNYTRYGDVLPLLLKSDDQYIISNSGDETSLKFDAMTLPPLPKGWKRDFFIHSVGWVKDGDLNTAFGNQVEPLPFHGMKTYPPSDSDVYPDDREHRKYQKKYNTRVVSKENNKEFISSQAYNDNYK